MPFWSSFCAACGSCVSPVNCLASASFISRASVLGKRRANSGRAMSIHRFMVSHATMRGFAAMASRTPCCKAGLMLARNRCVDAACSSVNAGWKFSNTLSWVSRVMAEFISSAYSPDHRKVFPSANSRPDRSTPRDSSRSQSDCLKSLPTTATTPTSEK